MRWLVAIIEAVLRVLLPALLKRTRRTSEDGDRRPELRDRLRSRIEATWLPGPAGNFPPSSSAPLSLRDHSEASP